MVVLRYRKPNSDSANPRSPKGFATLLASIREQSHTLQNLNEAELCREAEAVRTSIEPGSVISDLHLVHGFSCCLEALRRALNVRLYDVQIVAGLVLVRGGIAEMQTGEGKTLAAAPAAVTRAFLGLGVHVVTPNHYLAKRDCEMLRPAFQLLGLTAGLLQENASHEEKRGAYDCDITYGPAHEFGFDYLRDQLTLRGDDNLRLGTQLTRILKGDRQKFAKSLQRKLSYCIIDEIDNVLIDDAGSPLVLSDASNREAVDVDAHMLANQLAMELVADEHYRLVSAANLIELTPEGMEYIHADNIAIPVSQLRRAWADYVEQAIRANFLFRRDVHYVIDEKENDVCIIDPTTGRIYTDRSWRDGLHQAIEVKEGLTVTEEKKTLAQITKQRFFRHYECVSGMTGTATGCEQEFAQVFQLQVVSIPLRIKSRRHDYRMRFFSDAKKKWTAIAKEVNRLHLTGRPILIGTKSIEDSEYLAGMLAACELSFQILNGKQNAEEAEIISLAGRRNAITIATNLAGRGTDIKLEPDVVLLGGLHVIVAEPHEAYRMDRQFLGRCARQGDPGSTQSFASADDTLLRMYGDWLIEPLRRLCQPNGEVSFDLESRIRRIQKIAQRRQFSARSALLKQDLDRESLFSHLTQ